MPDEKDFDGKAVGAEAFEGLAPEEVVKKAVAFSEIAARAFRRASKAEGRLSELQAEAEEAAAAAKKKAPAAKKENNREGDGDSELETERTARQKAEERAKQAEMAAARTAIEAESKVQMLGMGVPKDNIGHVMTLLRARFADLDDDADITGEVVTKELAALKEQIPALFGGSGRGRDGEPPDLFGGARGAKKTMTRDAWNNLTPLAKSQFFKDGGRLI